MENDGKIREQLINEVDYLRSRLKSIETQHSRTGEALRNSERKNKALFWTISDLVFVMKKDGTLLEYKADSKKSHPLFSGRIIGKNIRDTDLPSVCIATFLRKMRKALKEGTLQIFEYALIKNEIPCFYETRIMALNAEEILAIVHDTTESKRVHKKLQQSFLKSKRLLRETVTALSSAIEERDPHTAGHQQRVTRLTTAIAKRMRLPEECVNGIHMASAIHDIGKMHVPAEILTKPGKLTKLEFSLVKKHPDVGYSILEGIEFPWPVAKTVLQHHERLNGSGYPYGLVDKDIILEARILAIADVVEAMASHRPYRPALGLEKALEEISKNKDTLYDANITEICFNLFLEKKFHF